VRPDMAEGRPRQESGLLKHTPSAPGTTVPDPADVSAVLALSDERDQHERRLLAAERRAYADGYRDGHQDAVREADRVWSSLPPARLTFAPCVHELEERRWGPPGREHAGDRRPGDRFPMEAA
jgi:hypothetical protein